MTLNYLNNYDEQGEVNNLDNKKTYVCLGTCQAVVSEEQYNNGLTKCGAADCTMHGQPLVPGKKSDLTGKNIQTGELPIK